MAKQDNDWKKRLGVIYSTNPDFQFESGDERTEESLGNALQKLRVQLDKKNQCLYIIQLLK